MIENEYLNDEPNIYQITNEENSENSINNIISKNSKEKSEGSVLLLQSVSDISVEKNFIQDDFINYLNYVVLELKKTDLDDKKSLGKNKNGEKFKSFESNEESFLKKKLNKVTLSKENNIIGSTIKNGERKYHQSQPSFYTKRLLKYSVNLKNLKEIDPEKKRIKEELFQIKNQNKQLNQNYENLLQLMNFMVNMTINKPGINNNQFTPQTLKNQTNLLFSNKRTNLSFNYQNDNISKFSSPVRNLKKNCIKKKNKINFHKKTDSNLNKIIQNLDKKDQNKLLKKLLENNEKFKSIYPVNNIFVEKRVKKKEKNNSKLKRQKKLNSKNKIKIEKRSNKSTKNKFNSHIMIDKFNLPSKKKLEFKILSPESNKIIHKIHKQKNKNSEIRKIKYKKDIKNIIKPFKFSKNIYSVKKVNVKEQIKKIFDKIK